MADHPITPGMRRAAEEICTFFGADGSTGKTARVRAILSDEVGPELEGLRDSVRLLTGLLEAGRKQRLQSIGAARAAEADFDDLPEGTYREETDQ